MKSIKHVFRFKKWDPMDMQACVSQSKAFEAARSVRRFSRNSEKDKPLSYWEGRLAERCRISEMHLYMDLPEDCCLGASLEFANNQLHGIGNVMDVESVFLLHKRYRDKLPRSPATVQESCQLCRGSVHDYARKYANDHSLEFRFEPVFFINIKEIRMRLLCDFMMLSEAAVLFTVAGCTVDKEKRPDAFIGHNLLMYWEYSSTEYSERKVLCYDGWKTSYVFRCNQGESLVRFFIRSYEAISSLCNYMIKGDGFHHEEISYSYIFKGQWPDILDVD